MKKDLIITDLTRMRGKRVCIFGIDEHLAGVRPELSHTGIDDDYAFENSIEPFNVVEFNFAQKSKCKPPHTEDWEIDKSHKPRFIRRLSLEEKREFLERIKEKGIKNMFGANIHDNQYVNENEGNRSIGTIKTKNILSVEYSPKEGNKFNYRMKFLDQNNDEYNLPITDLIFRTHCDYLRIEKGMRTNDISVQLQNKFIEKDVYLRIGLSRPYEKMYNRRYLQINGIYPSLEYIEDPDFNFKKFIKKQRKLGIALHHVKLKFPYKEMREGQKEMANDVKSVIENRKSLIANAPTGIGKTAGVLCPALEYAINQDKVIFFVTSKQSQHKIAIDTLKKIKDVNKIDFSVVDIISKRDMCPRDIAKEHYLLFNVLCKDDQETGKCKYYRYNKSAINEIKENILHVEKLKEVCLNYGICPHKAALDAAENAKVIVCDYNYAFSDILDTLLCKIGKSLNDIILIIDEAHNLPDRIRNNLSGKLTLDMLKETSKEIREIDERLSSHLMRMTQIFNRFMNDVSDKDEKNIDRGEMRESINDILRETGDTIEYNQLIEKLKNIVMNNLKNDETKQYSITNLIEFLEQWNTELACSRIFTHKETPIISFKLLDPSVYSESIISKVRSTIMMSGTLYPTEMYADILGIKNAVLRDYKSPFPKENRLIIVTENLTTRKIERNSAMYKAIATKICKIVENVDGNTAVFFTSYKFMNDIVENIPEKNRNEILVEKRGMSKQGKNKLLDELKNMYNGVLFGVQGGSLSEGVDYPKNVLKTVIVIGLPLAPPELEVKNINEYYINKFGRVKGRLYGYTYPAIIKSLQAAGRGIRSEKDICVIVLMDYRFGEERYRECLPPDYDIQFTDKAEELCKEFFAKVKMRIVKQIQKEKTKIMELSPALKILGLVKDIDGKYGIRKIAGILSGSKAKYIFANHYDRSPYYNILSNWTNKRTINVINELLSKGYVKQDKRYAYGKYKRPVICLTEKGQDAIANHEEIELKTLVNLEKGEIDQKAFCALKNWRKKVADENNLLPYIIFHDKTLKQLAVEKPTTKDQLGHIWGVGKTRAEKYGDEIINLIKENEREDTKKVAIIIKDNSEQTITQNKIYSVEKMRERYSNAYKKWTQEDDVQLKKEFLEGKRISELANSFQRKTGAIRSRLKKLNLIIM